MRMSNKTHCRELENNSKTEKNIVLSNVIRIGVCVCVCVTQYITILNTLISCL